MQGQGLYTGKTVNKFYPIAFAEDIASKSSDEDTAGLDNDNICPNSFFKILVTNTPTFS